jgi:hypothetical protein
MKSLSFSIFGIAILLLVMVVLLINKPIQAYDCCPPPPLPAAAARFQQNAQVTVYLDMSSGFTADERTAIKAGLEDWNDEPNNSGVKYTVVATTSPPAPGGNNTIIASFVNSPGNHESQLNMSDQRTNGVVTKVWGVLTFWKQHSEWYTEFVASFSSINIQARRRTRDWARQLRHQWLCEGSNIMYPSRNQETFITPCDNAIIKTDPVYPSPTP